MNEDLKTQLEKAEADEAAAETRLLAVQGGDDEASEDAAIDAMVAAERKVDELNAELYGKGALTRPEPRYKGKRELSRLWHNFGKKDSAK